MDQKTIKIMEQYEFFSISLGLWVACAIHDVESLQSRGFETRKKVIAQTPYTFLEI